MGTDQLSTDGFKSVQDLSFQIQIQKEATVGGTLCGMGDSSNENRHSQRVTVVTMNPRVRKNRHSQRVTVVTMNPRVRRTDEGATLRQISTALSGTQLPLDHLIHRYFSRF